MIQNKRCSNCGGNLKFNPKTQQMHCEQCNSYQNIKEDKKINNNEKSKELEICRCPSCGAQIITSDTSISTFCIYCKNTNIQTNKLKDEFHPHGIIPFQATKEDAIKAFEALQEGQSLVPQDFLTKENIKEIRGIYIPFWLLDINVKGKMKAKTKITKMSNTASASYTENIKNFQNTREGEIGYKLVPIDGSTHFDDDIMQSIEPFDYKDLKPYSSDYLAGFLSEIYDVKSDEALKIANKRIEKSAYEIFRKSLLSSTPTEIKVEEFKFTSTKVNEKFVLLPVYLLNVKYKNKIYTFAMNGQTKKMIGNLPSSKKEEVLFILTRFLLFSLITIFIVNFMAITQGKFKISQLIIGLVISLILAIVFLLIEKTNLKMIQKDRKINKYINDQLIEQRKNELVNENVITHDYSRAAEITLAGMIASVIIIGMSGGGRR